MQTVFSLRTSDDFGEEEQMDGFIQCTWAMSIWIDSVPFRVKLSIKDMSRVTLASVDTTGQTFHWLLTM